MEDALLLGASLGGRAHAYGVFDGHGGKRAAHMLSRHLPDALRKHGVADNWSAEALTLACQEVDAAICRRASVDGWDDGSTALVAIIEPAAAGKTRLTLLNVGDCDAIICRLGDGRVPSGGMVTRHRPTEPAELARLEALGVAVSATGRVSGLAVSRAFGDASYKGGDRAYLTAEPEVITQEWSESEASTTILVLACDGLWDFVSHQEACAILAEALALPTSGACDAALSADELSSAALKLADAALDRGGDDNVSVLVLSLDVASRPQ